jgi:hypothetical protein
MKNFHKLLVCAFAVMAIGAGCLGIGGQSEATGPWWLAFDLPAGWGMYANYSKNVTDPGAATIDRKLTDVILQSTSKPVVLPGKTAGKDVSDFVDKDFTYIRVFRYDVNLTKIPSDAEDLGNGFYKLVNEKGTTYYLKGQYGIYKFSTTQVGQELSVAEAVIMTAKEVTGIEDQTAAE